MDKDKWAEVRSYAKDKRNPDVPVRLVRPLLSKVDKLPQLEQQVERLEEALHWALGEHGDFEPRNEGDPPYWWRRELRKRAGWGLKYDPEKRTIQQEE